MRAILENPRYTGYAFSGRSTKYETLLDPDDVSAGHVVRFRKASPDRVVRSRNPAHPKIVEIEDFTAAQLLRKSKGSLRSARKTERSERTVKHRYLFRGRVRCDICGRKMEAQAERVAPRAALENVPPPVERDIAEIYAAIDSIGDVSGALRGHAPTRLEELYDAIDLQVRYKQNPHEADVSINPVGVNNAYSGRGGTNVTEAQLAWQGREVGWGFDQDELKRAAELIDGVQRFRAGPLSGKDLRPRRELPRAGLLGSVTEVSCTGFMARNGTSCCPRSSGRWCCSAARWCSRSYPCTAGRGQVCAPWTGVWPG